MSVATESKTVANSFWVISGLALVWNLIGVATYLMSVTVTEASLAAMPEAQRALSADIPAWVTSAYAIAVFAGAIASIGLLMKKAWSVPVFALSLAGIVVQMSYGLFMTDTVAVNGMGAVVMPIILIGIGAYLLWYSNSKKGTILT